MPNKQVTPQMEDFLKEQFGLANPKVKKLNGYDNVNYLVDDNSGQFIFKTYPFDEDLLEILVAENDVLLQLQQKEDLRFPRPVPFLKGDYIRTEEIAGRKTICRMLTFLAGDLMGDTRPSEIRYQNLGSFLAVLDLKLRKVKSNTLKARQWAWDNQYLHLNKQYLQDISDPHRRNIVRYFMLQYEENVSPHTGKLRKQVIHNDANEWNLLVEGDQITGLFDFGDLAHSFLINELAIAITYVCYDKTDPLKWASLVLKAYHAVYPLEPIEIKVLYYLIAARLCTSVCHSAHARKENPANTYATVSEEHAWSMLLRWVAINPIGAENIFRKAIGLPMHSTTDPEKHLERRHQSIHPVLSVSYKKPLVVTKAAFQYMYDAAGNAILDAYNNIPHVGHSHPKVVTAAQRQIAKLNTNTRYLYNLLPAYAEKLLNKFPDQLNKVFFVNSGSAASDLAIRMAHAHTGNQNILVMEHGYHGNTQTSIDISDYKFSNKKGQGQKGHILKTNIPDTYRGKYTNDDGSAGRLYAQEAIENINKVNGTIAAFVSEPVVGCGGQVPLAKGYLKELYPAIRVQGGVCISDEVQTGFGRLGDCFWGYEAQEVVPDIVILGKPIANGHPMGAVVCTSEIADSFGKGVEFFSSFGGNPVSCAIADAVLDIIEEESLQQNATEVGNYYLSLFRELQESHPCIGDVRGSGLFIGIEIVKPGTKDPDPELAAYIKNELRNHHILISTDGPYDSVLKSKPPLCFTKANAKTVVDQIRVVLEESS
ncbi:MAG: aminotransferase class III-fold pyridoxal phosphate-dependent enzyme [Bacteroidota bacterium]